MFYNGNKKKHIIILISREIFIIKSSHNFFREIENYTYLCLRQLNNHSWLTTGNSHLSPASYLLPSGSLHTRWVLLLAPFLSLLANIS